MPATTALGIPYPLVTDPPAGHTNMQSMATKVNDLFEQGFPGYPAAMAVGIVDVVVTAALQGLTSVTFPAGRFGSAPVVTFGVFVGPGGTVPYWVRTAGSITTAAVTVVVNFPSAQSTTLRIWWTAVQMYGGA